MKKWHYLLLSLTLVYLGAINKTWAHGVRLQYKLQQAIQIHAIYDDGQPMQEAQVIVYAPNDPTTPWLTGTTNQEGKFIFTPDLSQEGNWDVTVRQAGHGNMVSIPLVKADDADSTPIVASESSNMAYTPLQKALMAIMGVWGFVGTALFFSRRKTDS